MKKLTLLIIVGLCFGASGFAQGSSKEAEDYYKFYSYYHGKWQIEQEVDGKKESLKLHCYGSAGGSNIAVGKGETSVWGYDPKTRQWTGVGQLDNGSRFVMAISRPPAAAFRAGLTFAFTGTIWHADGKIHYVTRKFTCVDANTSRSVTTGIDQDGKAIPKVVATAKRIK
jgi:hypothetical protein